MNRVPTICGTNELTLAKATKDDEQDCRLDKLEECCDEAKKTLADHEKRITQNEKDIVAHDKRISTNETEITNIKNNIKNNYYTKSETDNKLAGKQDKITASKGIKIDGVDVQHTNSVSALTSQGLRKITYDAQGHITGSAAVAKADITALGIPGSDTDTKYAAGTNIVLESGNKFSVKDSPGFTGTPTAPTNSNAAASSTQLATLAFVQNAINRRLPKSFTTFYWNESAISVANNTFVDWNVWTAPANGWIIGYMYICYASNATGGRLLNIFVDDVGVGCGLRVQAAPNGITQLSLPIARHFTTGQKLQMRAWQTSGAALNVTQRGVIGMWMPD